MAKVFNRVRMATSTTGTGTMTLTTAITGYATAAESGVGDGDLVDYVIEDGNDFEVGVGTYSTSGTALTRNTVYLSKIGGTAGTSKLNLSGNAQVALTILKATLESRAGSASASFDAGAALGLLTNPFFEISQENGTTLISTIASGAWAADQWYGVEDSDAVVSVQNVPSPFSGTSGLSRLKSSIKAIATTADASIASGQYIDAITQTVEGTFWRSLGWGTADARAIDIVFIAQCSVTGTYPVAVRNAAGTRSYVTSVSLTANTPTVCMVTVPGDTGGAWETSTVASARISFGTISGTTYQATTINTWEAANKFSLSTSTNWAASGTTNFFQVGYAQVFPAGVLPFSSASEITGENLQLLLNMRRSYIDELARCERYYYKFLGLITFGVGGGLYSDTNQIQMAPAPFCLKRNDMRTTAATFSLIGTQQTDWAVSTSAGVPQSGFSITLSSAFICSKTAHGLTSGSTNLITLTTSGGFLFNDRM